MHIASIVIGMFVGMTLGVVLMGWLIGRARAEREEIIRWLCVVLTNISDTAEYARTGCDYKSEFMSALEDIALMADGAISEVGKLDG